MTARRVLEEVVHPFFFQEPADEGEVRLTVLHTVVARLVRGLELVAYVEALENLFEDVGHALVLEDATADLLGPEPELRHDLVAVVRKVFVALPFLETAD